MNQADNTPIYNLKAVVRQTGLKPDTLRAWERRYGLPSPQRTESGHRLYSQHDVEVIKWLTERQNEGLSIGRAIDLWHVVSFTVPAMQKVTPDGVTFFLSPAFASRTSNRKPQCFLQTCHAVSAFPCLSLHRISDI